MSKGTLFLVTGPNAAEVIEGARRLVSRSAKVVFPRRVITRPPGDASGEIYTAMTPAQFDMLRRKGVFALCWSRDGVNYGLPAVVVQRLASGRMVVAAADAVGVNEARRRFGNVVAVEGRLSDPRDLLDLLDQERRAVQDQTVAPIA